VLFEAGCLRKDVLLTPSSPTFAPCVLAVLLDLVLVVIAEASSVSVRFKGMLALSAEARSDAMYHDVHCATTLS
jgi:hypothetical protein